MFRPGRDIALLSVSGEFVDSIDERFPRTGSPYELVQNRQVKPSRGGRHSTERLWDKLVNRIYLGSEAWCKSIRKIVESKMLSDVHPRVQRAVGRPKMASIVASVAKAFGVSESWIRSSHGTEARLVTAWIGWYEGLHRLRSIAASLRLSSSGRVSDLIRQCERMLRVHPEMQRRVDDAFAALA